MELWRSSTTGAARESGGAVREAGWAARRSPALLCALLGLLALLPRVAGLADFLTTDEAYHWITRVERFSAAVAEGRWADTALTGHPGVTTMWLGSAGLWLERALLGAGRIAAPTPVEHLAWLRLPGGTLHALVVPAAYLLLRRLVQPRTALLAAGLWACSPYLIAHGRLLHLDALLTDFVTLSVLLLLYGMQSAKCRGQNETPRPAVLHAALGTSGVLAGLALLTKGPALILLPFAGLLVLGYELERTAQRRAPRTTHYVVRTLRRTTAMYALWLAVALLTVLALWPALWAAPGAALGRYVGEIVSNGGRPNGDGQFFLGRAVDDPGPLFYPLANLFRTTPLMLAGLLALPLALRRPRTTDQRRPSLGRRWSREQQALLALLAFVLFWTLVMTLGPKKFDRYVLPTWPALCVLAAAGLAAAYGRLLGWRSRQKGAGRGQTAEPTGPNPEPRAGWRRLTAWLVVALALALELWQPASVHPYYLSYYNPLLGGGRVAQRLFLIGWGEGMDQVGAWLSARPDIGYGPVLSALGRTLQPFVPVDVRDVEDLGRVPANYAVVYLESVQRAANPPIYAAITETVPLHRVVINGIEYARIYQLPRPFATPLAARFGEGLSLRGVTIAQEPARLVLTPAWDVRAPVPGDYTAFVHLLDAQGRRLAQVAVAPGGGEAPATGAWQPGQQIAVPLPLDLPPDLPPGAYTLTLGLFDESSGARLPLTEGPAADPATAGDSALLVGTVTLER